MDQKTISEVISSISASKGKTAQPRQRFRFPFTTEEAAEIYRAAYVEEVRLRGAYEYTATQETERVINSVAKWLTTPTMKRGLILMGQRPGTGKTTAARALITATAAASELISERFRGELEKINVEMYDNDPSVRARASERNDELNREIDTLKSRLPFFRFVTAQQLEAARMKEDSSEFEKLCSLEVNTYITRNGVAAYIPKEEIVVLDDAGTERRTIKQFGNSFEPFIEWLYSRYQSQRGIVITTNLSSPAIIGETYGPRVADRLAEMCETLVFGGESFRK